ncbi:hypothetical protein LSH36_462g02080 [Paralvinella palmiformis]|uniref:CCHC-type domain-containing protein n=1 Tax=Paralvinella palmiformis TaxID=53620 RepID=A0AAD9J9Y8_9ANNE|nr:hypothetical protein LSH36_462g02080 [Paralvinella palmiformis]
MRLESELAWRNFSHLSQLFGEWHPISLDARQMRLPNAMLHYKARIEMLKQNHYICIIRDLKVTILTRAAGLAFLHENQVQDVWIEAMDGAPIEPRSIEFNDCMVTNWVDDDAQFPVLLWNHHQTIGPRTNRLRDSVHCEAVCTRPPPPQCYQCHRWGHVTKNCRYCSRCFHCGRSHKKPLILCPTKQKDLVCLNSRKQHSTTYKGCPPKMEPVTTAEIRLGVTCL